MKNFFNSNKYIIEGLSNIVQVITVIVLVVITIWYANSTKQMADIMRDEFKISNRPYISINQFHTNLNGKNEAMEIIADIKNIGKIPGKLLKIETSLGGPKSLTENAEKNLLIYPNETVYQSLVIIARDTIYSKQSLKTKIFYTSSATDEKYCVEYNFAYSGNPLDSIGIKDSNICE